MLLPQKRRNEGYKHVLRNNGHGRFPFRFCRFTNPITYDNAIICPSNSICPFYRRIASSLRPLMQSASINSIHYKGQIGEEPLQTMRLGGLLSLAKAGLPGCPTCRVLIRHCSPRIFMCRAAMSRTLFYWPAEITSDFRVHRLHMRLLVPVTVWCVSLLIKLSVIQ